MVYGPILSCRMGVPTGASSDSFAREDSISALARWRSSGSAHACSSRGPSSASGNSSAKWKRACNCSQSLASGVIDRLSLQVRAKRPSMAQVRSASEALRSTPDRKTLLLLTHPSCCIPIPTEYARARSVWIEPFGDDGCRRLKRSSRLPFTVSVTSSS